MYLDNDDNNHSAKGNDIHNDDDNKNYNDNYNENDSISLMMILRKGCESASVRTRYQNQSSQD